MKRNESDAITQAEFFEFVFGMGEHYVILRCIEMSLLVGASVEGVVSLDPVQTAIDCVMRARVEAARTA